MIQWPKIHNERQMLEAGQKFSMGLQVGDTVFLSGKLGVGKTTLARGILSGLKYDGVVVSPTFSLVEIYNTPKFSVVHFDLFRIKDKRELEIIGFRDYFTADNLIIIEWPKIAIELLAAPDYDIHIEQFGENRHVCIQKCS